MVRTPGLRTVQIVTVHVKCGSASCHLTTASCRQCKQCKRGTETTVIIVVIVIVVIMNSNGDDGNSDSNNNNAMNNSSDNNNDTISIACQPGLDHAVLGSQHCMALQTVRTVAHMSCCP